MTIADVVCSGPERTRHRVPPLVSVLVGVVLYLLPTLLLLPLLTPIDDGLRAVGLLAPNANAFVRGFAVAMVVRWFTLPLLLLFVVAVEREPLSSIGIRMPSWKEVALAVVVGLAAFGAGTGLYFLVHGPGIASNTQLGEIFARIGVAGRVQIAINAAVIEEMLFRGLLIERLIWLTGRPWVAALVSLVLFVASHYITGSSSLTLALTGDFVGGIALVGLYMLRRNLVTNTIAHAFLNVYVVLGAVG